ncbi:MAG: hypothetical protein LBC77_04250 [Spirochaetaceae bacterium]|jgi:hypothetical protein|nr:hypothetical protein [Spirochaetaceae bacterium]
MRDFPEKWGGGGSKYLLAAALMIITAAFVTAQEGNAGFSLAGGKFGQLNVKAGLDLKSQVKGTFDGEYMGADMLVVEWQNSDLGFNLGAEYLSPLLFGIFKGGIGVQYAFPRTSWAAPEATDPETGRAIFSFLPIYAALQLHPSKSFKELFIRGNIGYALCLKHEEKPEDADVSKTANGGGLYWGIAAGFEFDWGLIIEGSYSENHWPVGIEQTGYPSMEINLVYSKIGVSVGYRLRF